MTTTPLTRNHTRREEPGSFKESPLSHPCEQLPQEQRSDEEPEDYSRRNQHHHGHVPVRHAAKISPVLLRDRRLTPAQSGKSLHGGFAGEPFTDESREYVFVAGRA
jgi:hypothetical protein